MSIFNIGPFKYFNFFADQIPAKVKMISLFLEDKFRKLVILRNLLAHSKL